MNQDRKKNQRQSPTETKLRSDINLRTVAYVGYMATGQMNREWWRRDDNHQLQIQEIINLAMELDETDRE